MTANPDPHTTEGPRTMLHPDADTKPNCNWQWLHQADDNNSPVLVMPKPAADPEKTARRFQHFFVPGSVGQIMTEVPVEVMRAYYTLAAWNSAGEEISIERYLAEVQDSADVNDSWPLDWLIEMRLLIDPDEADERYRDFVEAMYGERWIPGDDRPPRTPKKPKRKIVVPDPFPTFLDGRWEGTPATLAATCPRPEIAVVYRLLDEDGQLMYIGSTGNVYNRFSNHQITDWASYEAVQCADRESAYWLEAREIIRHRPPRNGREYVGGRMKALLKLYDPFEKTAEVMA